MRFGTASKFAFSFVLALLAFLLPWQISLGSIPLIIILEMLPGPFRPSTAAGHKTFIRFIVYLIFLGAFIVFVNGLLIQGGQQVWRVSWMTFYSEGIEFGLNVSGRLMLLSSAILLFFVSTPIKAFVDFLGHMGLSRKVVTVILLTTFYLEQLPIRIKQIFWAQEARGAPVRANIIRRMRSFFSVLAPLILSSLAESVERGMALELRGFRGFAPTSSPRDFRDLRMASLILIFSTLAILLHAVWN